MSNQQVKSPFVVSIAAFLLVGCSLGGSFGRDLFAQDAADTVTPPNQLSIEARLSDPVYLSWVAHAGTSQCLDCHFAGPNAGQIESGRNQLTEFSRRNEMATWLMADKHTVARRRVEPLTLEQLETEMTALSDNVRAQASRAIENYGKLGIDVDPDQIGLDRVPREWIGASNILSRRICDKLFGAGNVETEEGYAEFRQRCLSCHGGYHDNRDLREATDLARPKAGDLSKAGIDCLYCHEEGDRRWVGDHPDATQWRLLTPEKKRDAGMRDMVNMTNQAQLCFDCHIGNRKNDQFVSHEMYAAGHPPLPSIELHRFCEKMPQHWRTPAELYESLSDFDDRDEYFTTNYRDAAPAGTAGEIYWNTRKMLIGSLSARIAQLELYIDTHNMLQHTPWGDYSLYDCSACHHELRTESQRQQRGFPGAPGRPRPSEWPDAVVQAACGLLGEANTQQWTKLERDFDQAFSRTPFGNPSDVNGAAIALSEFLKSQLKRVERRPIAEREARTMLQCLASLANDSRQPLLTYDAVRQTVWAMQTIAAEMKSKGALLTPYDAIMSLGNSGKTGVDAALPATRNDRIFPDGLGRELPLRARFDSEAFIARLKSIASGL